MTDPPAIPTGSDLTGASFDPLHPPFVSVVVPCRNEAPHIEQVVRSILATSWPHERLEVLVVDGQSDDGTGELLRRIAAAESAVRVLENPGRTAPTALNIGIRAARGEVIVRMDAHATYAPEYIPVLVRRLLESGADNVGAPCVTEPAASGAIPAAIAIALSHPFGVGNAHFRIGTTEERWVDTVPFGCFRRALFDRIGLFDEALVRNQDDELNARILRAGGRLLLVPDVRTRYVARGSLGKLARMYFQYGYYKPLAARKAGAIVTVRQLVPAALVLVLAAGLLVAPWHAAGIALFGGTLGAYVLAALLVSAREAGRHGVGTAAALPSAFAALHFGYGTGWILGAIDFWLLRRDRGRGSSTPSINR